MNTGHLYTKISFLMISTILLFLATVGGVVYWMSDQLDRRARADSIAMITGAMANVKAELAGTAVDYSIWDAAFEWLHNGEMEDFYLNYASGATYGDVVQLIAVTGGPLDGTLSWTDNEEVEPVPDLVPDSILNRMVEQVQALPMSQNQTVSFFDVANGSYYAFVGTRIEPHDPAAVGITDASMLAVAIFGIRIDQAFLTETADLYFLANMTLSASPRRDQAWVPLLNEAGEAITYVAWDAPRPGTIMLRRIGVPLGAVVAIFTALSVLVTVTARRNARELVFQEARASTAARTDSLTGLPNRMALTETLSRADTFSDRALALLFLDVNSFKIVNDTVGHRGGDELINLVAKRLTKLSQQASLLVRVGGDEFVILVEGSNADERAHDLAHAVRVDMLPEFRLQNRGFNIGFAIGIASRENPEVSGTELMRRADIAMYRAKKLGTAEVVAYDPSIDSESQQKRIIEEVLREELKTPENFEVHYQPIIDASTGQMVKAEALARWAPEKLGRIGPDVFIAVAEESGLIVALGKVLLQRICVDLQTWPTLNVSINISPAQLNDGDFVEDLVATLDEMNIDPRRIEIELTEGLVVSNTEMAAYKLDALHEVGFGTSLDDFGTGFSSIGYLKKLPFNTLKIDKSFVDGIASDPSALEMVQAMVLIGHSLGQTVVCEGVETADQAQALRNINCDLLQGYHFSRPVTIAKLRSFEADDRVAQSGAA